MSQGSLFGDTAAAPTQQQVRQTSQPRHTWFFCLRPDPAEAQRIYARAEQLLAASGVSGKRISPDRLHVTLELVGHDIDEALVAAACRAADTVRVPCMDVRFDASMTFSAPSGPFVLLGGEGLDEVRRLRTTLACAMADVGFSPPRAYEPHMTLCYDPRHQQPRLTIEHIVFRASEFALVKSHIGHSRHEVLRTWPLLG